MFIWSIGETMQERMKQVWMGSEELDTDLEPPVVLEGKWSQGFVQSA